MIDLIGKAIRNHYYYSRIIGCYSQLYPVQGFSAALAAQRDFSIYCNGLWLASPKMSLLSFPDWFRFVGLYCIWQHLAR